ncbi:lanthionine synthetase LanC family protein [Amycolatopsis rubida]|uniref:Lanthionine synthetase C-like protein n=1 Tax=Amycolatopsis rubida TaxID=112413 RepID=A0A1I5E3L0_9PSEU|nr:lanthionine synthetase LanC family protein [Amycolatopsis rubida]SFO05923.1 Lanthionine synthetase C-like protein [Amycolatopsis rubida]
MKSLACPDFHCDGGGHPETLLCRGPLTAALGEAVRAGQAGGDTGRLRDLLDRALTGPSADAPGESAFDGDPALASTLQVVVINAPHLRGRYQGFLDLADARLDMIVHRRLQAARERLRLRRPLERAEFSLREGLVGLGACLLQRPGAERDPMLVQVAAYAVELVLSADRTGRPGWWVHHSPSQDRSDDGEWPDGHACFTLLDGSAGIMALLALARLRGIRVPLLDAALRSVSAWHDAHRLTDEHGLAHWPEVVTDPRPDPRPIAHQAADAQGPGLCGNLGIARATQLAGIALCDPALRRSALATARTALTRDTHLFETGGICHGPHGAAVAALRIAADEPGDTAADLAEAAANLLRAVRPDARLGDIHGGLLDGTVGERITRSVGDPRIALPPDGAAAWDSLLLLAPHRPPPARPLARPRPGPTFRRRLQETDMPCPDCRLVLVATLNEKQGGWNGKTRRHDFSGIEANLAGLQCPPHVLFLSECTLYDAFKREAYYTMLELLDALPAGTDPEGQHVDTGIYDGLLTKEKYLVHGPGLFYSRPTVRPKLWHGPDDPLVREVPAHSLDVEIAGRELTLKALHVSGRHGAVGFDAQFALLGKLAKYPVLAGGDMNMCPTQRENPGYPQDLAPYFDGNGAPWQRSTKGIRAPDGTWQPHTASYDGMLEHGFLDAAQLKGDRTPTVNPEHGGDSRMPIDRLIVSRQAPARFIPSTYRVHPPKSKSDHLMVSCWARVTCAAHTRPESDTADLDFDA